MIPGNFTLSSILLLPLAVAAFLLPGWLVSRRLGSPARTLTAFLASVVLWFYLTLGCDLVGMRLSRGSLIGGWLVLCVFVVWWTRNTPTPSAQTTWRRLKPRGAEWFWFAAAAAGLSSIAARAIIDPLSGWDNGFRWDYLAHAMLTHGNLHFYPPVRAADFEIYAWCDGIPPLISLLNAWLYLITNVTHPSVTAVRVIAEALLLGTAVFGLGRELWGERGGWPAVGLLGTSALFLWGVAIGQETGLLALTLITLVWLLERYGRDPQTSTIVWAGVAAGVGALSRDYGLAFAPFGLAVLGVHGQLRRGSVPFALAAAFVAAPWYLRNWALTGNPLFPQSLGGLFPTNAVYAYVNQCIGDYWRLASPHVKLGLLAGSLAVVTGAVFLAGTVGVWRARRIAVTPLAAILLVTGLWLWSVPQTAGGINYSLRVLAPAVALGAALGGWLGTLPAGFGRAAVLVITIALSADAMRRAWFLPAFPRASMIPWSLEPWRAIRLNLRHAEEDPLWDSLVPAAQGSLIAVDNPNAHTALVLRGGRAAMLFSPVFGPCFDEKQPFDEAVRQLRSSGVRFFVLSVDDPVARSFIAAHPFFRTLCERHKPLIRVESLAVFDLDKLTRPMP